MRLDTLPIPEPDADAINRAAEKVLGRPEFRRPAPTIFERIEDGIREALGRALEKLFGSGAGTLVAWLVLVVAIGLVAYFVYRLGQTATPDRAGATRPEMVELSRSPAEWRTEAEQAERKGRWKYGLLARYRALVGQLVLDGVLDEIPGRTAGEYRREVEQRRPDLHPTFAEATTLFERAWYGDESTGAVERDRFVQLALQASGARR